MPRRRRALFVERFEDRINMDNLPNGMPILNSFPTAPAAVFIDFDGDAGSATEPYDRDGDGTTFNAQEQADILESWREVSVYFAMFNVNVTTIWPGSTPKAWLCCGNNISGGYSAVNVFPNSQARSFNQSSDARNRNSGLTHEFGHNFGNSHQSDFNSLGVETADYISAKEPLRGYLMGVDFSGTVKKWSIGHTSNASGLQDDLAVIAADLDNFGGDGYRPDAVGDTIATAATLAVNGSVQSATGIIERYADLDAFAFNSIGGRYAITVAPDVPSGLDAVLEVRDAANTVLAVADTVANGQTLTMTLPAGTFYAFVGSKQNYADLGQYVVTVKPGAPDGFQTTNVGLTWHTGSTTYDAATGTYAVSGSGLGITSSADQFQYAWRYLSGDGTITARVTNVENTNANAKAGVMIRETLSAGSRHAAAMVPFSLTPQMIWRTNSNGSTSSSGGSSTTFTPRWVRLTKTGGSIVAQHSTNGTTWTTISTQTVNVGSNFLIGLATTSNEDEETNLTDDINDATYTDVTITGFSDPLAVTNAALAAPANVAVSLGGMSDLAVTWDAVAGATGYRVERSQDGVTFTLIGTTTSATTYTDANPPGSQKYWYRVRATDAVGRSPASNADLETNRPSAVKNLEFTSYTTTSIVLDWFDTDSESGFRVERSADAGANWTTLTTIGKNIPSYTATGLTIATPYSFRVTPTSGLGDGVPLVVAGMTRLATVTGLAFGTITSNSVQLNWTDIAGETGYRIERSTDGTTFTSLTTVGAGITTFTNTGLTPETEYYYRVVGVASGTESTAASSVVMCGTLPNAPVASPWLSMDIGLPASQRGMSALTSGAFKVISGGADIGGSADAFRFTYQQLVGNGAITARVATLEATGGTSGSGAEIGVMVRESLNAGSRHAHVALTNNSGVQMQHRSSTGGGTTTTGAIATTATSYWVRIKRVGNVVTSYASPDGAAWTQVGTVTLSNLAQSLFIGLSSSAFSSTTLNTSTYTDVSIAAIGVQGVTIDDGTAQRSTVRSLTVTFNAQVSLPANPAAAFSVVKTGGGAQAFSVDLTGSTPTQTIAKLTFAAPLTDGNYTLTVLASQVTDAGPLALGTMGANHSVLFHRLFGDSNGDRTVDATDLGEFGNRFGSTAGDATYWAAFDFNLDGSIDAGDFAEFGNRFGMTI